MPDQLRTLAYGLRALHLDSTASHSGVTVLCVSEFGRTADENGDRGTDHGGGGLVVAMGQDVKLNTLGPVPSRVYGCDAATWPGLTSASNADLGLLGLPVQNGTFVSPRQHLFGVLAELMTKVLGTPAPALSQILPGYVPVVHAMPGYL